MSFVKQHGLALVAIDLEHLCGPVSCLAQHIIASIGTFGHGFEFARLQETAGLESTPAFGRKTR